jgi:hypothetical protein
MIKPVSIVIVVLLTTSMFLIFPEVGEKGNGVSISNPLFENNHPSITDAGDEDMDTADRSTTRSSRYIDVDYPSSDAQLIVTGGNSADYAGHDIAFGDVDADGYEDMIIGVPYADGSKDNPRGSSGEVLVIFGYGNQTFPGTVVDAAKAEYDMIIYGKSGNLNNWDNGDSLGYSVASGDINGDGYDDIIMGAFGAQPAANRWDSGGVFVVYGDKRSVLEKTIDLDTDADFVIWGPRTRQLAGREVGAGDFDNDGYDDILVGVPYGDPEGRADAGITYVVFGGNDLGSSEDLARGAISPSTITIIGNRGHVSNWDIGDRSGIALAAGDFNGDDYDDILIGAQGANWGGTTDSGGVYVITGWNSMSTYINLTTDARVRIRGADNHDYAGTAVASGDIDGDNYDDILIGGVYADGQPNNIWTAGEAYIVYGSSEPSQNIVLGASADVIMYGNAASDIFGWGVAVGDLNGDKYADFAVGGRGMDMDDPDIMDSGMVYIFHGGPRADLGNNLNPKNDAVGSIYGMNQTDMLGFSIAMGDFDGDGADDIATMGYLADGPLEARDSCGEVYLVYGKPPPVRINSIEVLDSNGAPTDVIYPKYPYTIRVNIADILSVDDLAEVVLNIDPEGADLQYKWSKAASSDFSEVKDTPGLTKFTSVPKDAVKIDNHHWNFDFNMEFSWGYPTTGLLECKITAVGDDSLESTKTITDVFEVEDDLEFTGDLVVTDEAGERLTEGDWASGSETLTFTNLTVVYEGTTDIYPPQGEFSVDISDDSNTWSNSTESGKPIYIKTPLKPITNPSDQFRVSIVNPVSTSPRANVVINISVDAEEPTPPTSIKFKRELIDDSYITAVNSTSFIAEWTSGDDKFSGIKGYYYALENNEGTTSGTFTEKKYAEITSEETGSVILYVWAADVAGNIGKATSKAIFIDLDKPVFSSFEPSAEDWIRSKNFNCSIIIDDKEGIGIDLSSIRYKISSQGTTSFGSWLSVSEVEPLQDNQIKAGIDISDDLPEGKDNYIRFLAEDLAGNVMESSNYLLKIDASSVRYEAPEPDFTKKQDMGDVPFTITLYDLVSDVNINTIQYKFSTMGTAGYTDWKTENLFPIINTDEEDFKLKFRVDLDLQPGKDNYIKFRAMDNAGNGYTESPDYRIWVNSPPEPVISSPVDNGKFKIDKAMTFSAAGTTDLDNDTLSYKWRSSIDGEFGFLKEINWNKLSEGIHEITLEVTDGITVQEAKITVEIEKKESAFEGTGVFGASKSVDVAIIIVLIILIILIFFFFILSRKKLKESEEKAKLVSPELVSVPGAPGMAPGIDAAAGPGLQPGYGAPTDPSYPQLPGTGHPMQPPTYDYGAPAGAAAGAGQPFGAPGPAEQPIDAPQGQVAPSVPQLPPSVGAEYPHLDTNQKLELLEEKFLTGQISENLYMQLKSKYSSAAASEVGMGMPPEGPSTEGGWPRDESTSPTYPQQPQYPPQPQPQPPGASDFSFKRPEDTTPAPEVPSPSPPPPQPEPGPQPYGTPPPQPRAEWEPEEDVLSRIQIPGPEERSPSGKKLKKVRKI